LPDQPWYAGRRAEEAVTEPEEPESEVEPVVEFTYSAEPEPVFDLEEDEG
jgi:hypothetical protein